MKFLSLLFSILFIDPLFAQDNLKDKYDVKQYILDLQISNASTFISGNVTIKSVVTASILDTFVVDLINTANLGVTYMLVDSVIVDGILCSYSHQNGLVIITLINPKLEGQMFSVQIFYHGNGKAASLNSFIFYGICKTTYVGKTHTVSLSQPNGSKYWWPCKQDLKDKADSVIFYITTDSINKSGSNGILKSKEILSNGKVRYKWETHYPIDYYLISFAVGKYDENITYAPLSSGQDSVLLQSLLFSQSTFYDIHLKAIEKTKKLIYLFSSLLGDYPFKNEKYGYCIYGSIPAGGMEHQTMSTMGPQALDTSLGTSHELAHQWFGDYVTCATWNDLWLNEGFASYMEYINYQFLVSQTTADSRMSYFHSVILSHTSGSVFVPDSLLLSIPDLFSYLVYHKGAAVIHSLRYEINNDSLFFMSLRNYLNAYAFSSATTEDFKNSVEITTNTDFTTFFNQWIYGQGYPIFNINWCQNNDTLTVVSNQTTSTSATPLFKTHFDFKINYSASDTTLRLYQENNTEVFKIPITSTVTSIEIDPKNWLINDYNITSSIVNYNTDFTTVKNYPNPFNKSMKIEYNLEKPSIVKIEIINQQGQIIESVNMSANRGMNKNIIGSNLQNGIYFIKIYSDNLNKILKVIKE